MPQPTIPTDLRRQSGGCGCGGGCECAGGAQPRFPHAARARFAAWGNSDSRSTRAFTSTHRRTQDPMRPAGQSSVAEPGASKEPSRAKALRPGPRVSSHPGSAPFSPRPEHQGQPQKLRGTPPGAFRRIWVPPVRAAPPGTGPRPRLSPTQSTEYSSGGLPKWTSSATSPQRKHPSKWSLTMPTDCMNA